MANDYKIKLEVRGKNRVFEAESVAELNYLFATELFRLDVLTSPVSKQDKDEEAAKLLLEQYRKRFRGNRKGTPIFRKGFELDIAKCYLSRRTMEETVDWLKKEKDFDTSISAVGRYFSRFELLPAAIR